VPVVESGDSWRWDTGTDHGAGWLNLAFDDAAWASGPSQLGYGDADEATRLPASSQGEPSVYFRRVAYIDGQVQSATLDTLFDDGIAVWINGTLVSSNRVADGLDYADFASSTSAENETATTNVSPGVFVDGQNIIAVMVKNRSASSSDLSFDLSLTVDLDACPAGPSANAVMCDETLDVSYATSGLPLLESNPGAPVALFVDFDGGTYHSGPSFTGYDTDGDLATFNAQEQADIIGSWEHVSQYFAMFDVNITTDDAVRAASTGWGWILVTEEVSGGVGSLSSAAIGTPPLARSYVGASTVRGSDRSRRIAHELGHNFVLEHNGVWDAGVFYKWEDWSGWDGSFGSIMGGGGEGEINGWAIAHDSTASSSTQDSMAVIQQKVVAVGGGAGWRTDDFSGTTNAAMCDGGHRLYRNGVLGHPGDEDLFELDWLGGPMLIEIQRTEVASTDPIVDLLDDGGAPVAGSPVDGDGWFANLPAGRYQLRVRTRSGLANGYDQLGVSAFDDVARSELGAYQLTVD
jgi:hypothetical protein